MANNIENATEALYSIPSDLPREEWVKIGIAGIAAGLTIDHIVDWSRTGANFKSEKDVRDSFKSVNIAGGISAASLFWMAKQYGWENPNNSIKEANTLKSNVDQVWNAGIPADENHPYIVIKKGKPNGLKIYPLNAKKLYINGHDVTGYLMMPCWDNHNLQTIQFIPPGEGKKLNLPNASFDGGYFICGQDRSRIYVCEGIGQAWAAAEVSGKSSVSTFGLGRTETVIKKLKLQFPGSELIICADAGQEKGIQKAARDNNIKYIFMPEGSEKNSDINDLMISNGKEALMKLLNEPIVTLSYDPDARNRIHQKERGMRASEEKMSIFAGLKHHIDGIALQAHHSYIFGASGSFKTTFLTALCIKAVIKNPNLKVHYWGFDVSPPYVEAVVRLCKELSIENQFFLFDTQTAEDLKSHYQDYLSENIRLDDVIVVLDTYKFLSADVNTKNANKDAMHFIKNIIKLGAAWISIGHTNKDGQKQSGTAEIEQDSDGLLKIESYIDGKKGLANIVKGGRCRWQAPNLTISTELIKEDKEKPYLFWYHAIKHAEITDGVDVERLKKVKELDPTMKIVLEMIVERSNDSDPFNKTSLIDSIKKNESLDLSKAQIKSILNVGEGKYWRTIKDKENNNRILYHPIEDVDYESLSNKRP
jgi:phage/plasmid primase-like uncharacterized protein